MRLNSSELAALVGTVQSFLPQNFKGEFKLYGSRVHDHMKGGDIDLVLICDSDQDAESLSKIDYKIVAAMKSRSEIGDRKIDFKVLTRSLSVQGFFSEALKSSVKLF